MRSAVALVLALLALPGAAEAYLDTGTRRPQAPVRAELWHEAVPEGIRWRESRALGSPSAGRLVRGVRLPAEGARYFTWDPLLRRSPNRGWRRHGTDDLVRLVLGIVRDYARAHPRAPRLGIGDLSRPRGGWFGPRHVSHQNGLDVDVYYPRLDRKERPPKRPDQIDRRLAQDLVDRFVRAGAERVFVGPGTALGGPSGVVQVLVDHDNHLHVRIRAQ
ncbi:MAG TPA: penicillin-insensitive murein endopeptidase [Gaiellaceae bacterium]|nr:penicillin-insensitive murein endopeptidase [Gaiellaceae bacterium]